MPLTRNNFAHLPSARRSILYAIRFGQELDLYEGLDRILQHISNVAERDDPETHAYYCAPQGHVTARGTVKLRDLDRLYDPDYRPSPQPSGTGEPREEVADEELETGVVADDDEDEQEERADEDRLAGGRLNNADYMEAPSQRIDHASSESTSAFERSFATCSSTEVPYKLSRLPDFRLSHAWLRDDGEELVRYINALVEVKLRTENTITSSDMSHKRLINLAIGDMAPQVIEAVQVAFAQRPDQKEIVAIPTVNSFCCFVYFARSTVPVLDPAMANQGEGFQDPAGVTGRKLYDKYGRYVTNSVQIISGGGDFFDTVVDVDKRNSGQVKGTGKGGVIFGDAFVTHWNEYIEWTRGNDIFPQPDEED
ncbi:hypothetical protein LXA43DRAFT_1028996 [Ganoderma leucocontextum]|nr:hypothetical protein LXA43DRAFT_1028996 [Ganoderma leucocontextum]